MGRPQQGRLFDMPAQPDSPLPEPIAETTAMVAQVVVDRPVDRVFTYLVPPALESLVGPGRRVRVPFGAGNRSTVGFCVGVGTAGDDRRLKTIEAVLDRTALVGPEMLSLTKWMAERYLCSWGQVLHSIVPAGVRSKAGTRLYVHFRITDVGREALKSELLPTKQRAVLQVLADAQQPMRIDALTEAAGCGTSPVHALREKGWIAALKLRADAGTSANAVPAVPRDPDPVLTADQHRVLQTILETVRSGSHRTLLLHGVTGSGKTEVYIRAMREVISYGRQVIVLVPEISLTPQTIRRFRARFDSVAVLHSHLTDAERHRNWQRIATGRVQVVVGARSAVFAPTPHPGLIVIDEEHETTFKQETAPRYHAREVARERARREGIPLLLGSATPTMESWWRAQNGEDVLLSLPERVGGRPLPPVGVVDIRGDPQIQRGHAIGRVLESCIRRALADGGQVILFLNVRGHSPVLWCRRCGQTLRCPHCDITLTWHRVQNAALCHLCEYRVPPPSRCPTCDQPGLKYLGVGTQRLEREVQAKFPDVRSLRMDSDAMRRRGSHDEALEAFRTGAVRILLGTQMIAKGLDFPNVTLVGVVDADTTLHQPDFRAAERTFQLVSQVAGRTGRGAQGGRVIVQTAAPDQPAIRLAATHDFVRFAEQELQTRRRMGAPPFVHLVRCIVRGEEQSAVREAAHQLADLARESAKEDGVRILGPAPAPIERLRGLWRWHLQLASSDLPLLLELARTLRDASSQRRDVETVFDVDPVDLR